MTGFSIDQGFSKGDSSCRVDLIRFTQDTLVVSLYFGVGYAISTFLNFVEKGQSCGTLVIDKSYNSILHFYYKLPRILANTFLQLFFFCPCLFDAQYNLSFSVYFKNIANSTKLRRMHS